MNVLNFILFGFFSITIFFFKQVHLIFQIQNVSLSSYPFLKSEPSLSQISVSSIKIEIPIGFYILPTLFDVKNSMVIIEKMEIKATANSPDLYLFNVLNCSNFTLVTFEAK